MRTAGRWTALAVGTLATAALLVGCSTVDSKPSSSSTPGAPASGDITVATTSSNQPAMTAVVAAFEKSHPSIKVTVNYADTAPYQSNLRTQLSAGTAPDVFTVWAGSGNAGAVKILQKAGYLTDLSSSAWVAKIPASLKKQIAIDGKYYGLPSKLDAIGAIYDKGTLEDLGLKVPTTWTQLLSFCKDVKSQGKVAFALGNQTTWVTQLIDYALVANTVYGKDPTFDRAMSSGDATFAKSGWVTAMNKYLAMDKAGCFNSDPLGTDVNASYNLLADGKAVAAVQVMSSLPQIQATAAKGTEFGFFVIPATDSAKQNMPVGVGVSFALNKKAKNAAAGRAFIDWLGTADAIRTWFAASPGIPTIDVSGVNAQPAVQAALDQIASGRTAPFPDANWPNPQVQNAHLIGVQNLFSGSQDPQQVLASMQSAYDGT